MIDFELISGSLSLRTASWDIGGVMLKSDVLTALYAGGFSAYLRGFSAIDSFLGRPDAACVQILTNAGTAELARLFEALRFPGIDIADAALDCKTGVFYFYCTDSEKPSGRGKSQWGRNFPVESRPVSFCFLDFYRDCSTGNFLDYRGIYPVLAGFRNSSQDVSKINAFQTIKQALNPGAEHPQALMDAALILAKYFPQDCLTAKQSGEIAALLYSPESYVPGKEAQRLLLCGLLGSPNPGMGFQLLKNSGFIDELWPELAGLDNVDHSKEFHPEGNAWNHTMETFRYRKAGMGNTYDLRLSLGLLLHDVGKPIAESAYSRRRFDGHAELGEKQARRFLERLGFTAPLINDVCYLVKNHMLPAALPRLPFFRTGEIMASPVFPVLMELYRCDESSSFKGLDGYYECSAVYQSYLRNSRNPYRCADGKKLNRMQINSLVNKR